MGRGFFPWVWLASYPKNTVHGGTFELALAIQVLLVCSMSFASHLVVVHFTV